jgi:hypothetical protein
MGERKSPAAQAAGLLDVETVRTAQGAGDAHRQEPVCDMKCFWSTVQ